MTVTAARGFVAAGMHCGIKASADPDFSLVASADHRPVSAAAVFTQNLACAAPVQVSRAHLAATGGLAAAVVLNSGNANAATGQAGRDTAERTAAAVATALGCEPHEVLVCSTGLIGIPLDAAPMEAAAPALVAALAGDDQGGLDAATAIMTTDTKAKQAIFDGETGDGRAFTVGGMAKGAAMLAPDMATMLAVITTDAAASPDTLTHLLQKGVAGSFNKMTIDGCTSTNDTVIVLASGLAGVVDEFDLADGIADVCMSLARQMVADAEGATKSVTVRVIGAASDEEAATCARAIAESQLCKCSWYGQDPYWGRIVSDAGSCGVAFDPDLVSVAYGFEVVARNGVAYDHDVDALKAHMGGRDLEVTCDLGLGEGTAWIITNDLTHAYVDENMGTS